MERFALALPEFASYDVRAACDGSIGNWLDAMQQLECCQVAAANPQLLLQAFRYARSAILLNQFASPVLAAQWC